MPRRDAPLAVPIVDWRAVMQRSCTRKVRYTSLRDAVTAVPHVRARCADWTLRVYACAFADRADHWHIGHVPKLDEVRRIAAALRARAQDPDAA